jgi:predicted phage tail component-like protein
LHNFTFKGIQKEYITITKGRKRPAFAPMTRNILTIPNRPGGYLQSTQIDVRVLEIPVFIQSDTYSNLQKVKEDLAEWLVCDKPEELIFDDEIDRVYYAFVDGGLDLEEMVSNGEGVIRFVCPDPYKYGVNKTLPFASGQVSLNYYGTVESYPVVKTTIDEATTFISVTNGEDTMLIGQPLNVDVTPVNPFDNVLYDGMDTTTGWAQSAITLDGAIKAGTLSSNGVVFLASDYGAGTAWHGPALQKSLSEQIQDFQVDVTCKFETTTVAQVGRLEVYLLDINNKVIGKLAMKDYTNSAELTMPEILVRNDGGSQNILVRNQNDNYDNWYGVLRLKRVGQEYWAYTIRVNPSTGVHEVSKERYFLDIDNAFQSKLSSIVVHFAASGTYTLPALNQIHEISVVKYNTLTENQIANIAQPGDVIEFDHQNNIITKNGENILHEKDFASSFFPLKKGINTLTISPSSSVASAEVSFREKYL